MIKNLKRKPLSLAIATALAAGMTAPASAITLNNFDGTTTEIYLTGATAQDGLLRAFLRDACKDGLDEFQMNVTQPPNTTVYSAGTVLQSLYFCTIDGTLYPGWNGGADKKALIRKSSGDSGEGVAAGGGVLTINFIGDPTPDTTVAWGASNFTCATSASTAAGGTLQSIQQWSCTAFPSGALATAAGLADVEPNLLNQVLSPAMTSANLTDLQLYSTVSQLWGIPVTKNLRNALQAVQGKTVGSDNEADMPTLPRPFLDAVFAGNIDSWNKLLDGSFNPIASNSSVTAPTDTNMRLVRRPDSSGTQMSLRTMFLREFCSKGVPAFAVQTTTTCDGSDASVPSVSLQQGTSGLLGCLKSLNNAGYWAIGIASMSNRPAATPADVGTGTDANWRWIKVDGNSPTLFNGASGRYAWQTEATLFYRKTGASTPPGGTTNGTFRKFVDNVLNQLNKITVLGPVNTGGAANQAYATTPWQSGALVPAKPGGAAVDWANINTKPQSAITRKVFPAQNSCTPEEQLEGGVPVN